MEQIGNYIVQRKVGEGAFGSVYLCVDRHNPDLKVAIKIPVIGAEESERIVSNLISECSRLDSLDHPNILRFKHLIVEEDKVAMVVEYLDGLTPLSWLNSVI